MKTPTPKVTKFCLLTPGTSFWFGSHYLSGGLPEDSGKTRKVKTETGYVYHETLMTGYFLEPDADVSFYHMARKKRKTKKLPSECMD